MNKKIAITISIALLSVTLFQCKNNTLTKTVKLQPNDPFKNTIVESQIFEFNSKQDNVIEGMNGTIVVFPKGCFKNANGNIIDDDIKIELSEALSLDDMLLSNLTTTANGKQLETDGMIYFNATANGEQLTINNDNPIHIEIPTSEKRAGMMAYKGIRDEKGDMNWIEPKELENYLITIDINALDFLPQGFQLEVNKEMPYKNYKTATQGLTDSLYYNLSVTNCSALIKGFVPTNYNEPFYNKGKKVVNGKYTSNSYLVDTTDTHQSESNILALNSNCGIDPASIKVIKSEKYQNTLIATREFEERLQVIFKTCDNSLLDIYIQHLDKNLYELDSMAAAYCEEKQYHECYHTFYDFAQKRLTKVRQADKYAELLKGYFEKQHVRVRAELESGQKKLFKELKHKNNESKKVVEEYKKLLWKREKHRMETYGFNWTETGWINIDNGTLPKDWDEQPLEITVANGKQFDRVYTYVVYTSIKSLYRLNTSDNEKFYVGNDMDKKMLMPKKDLGIAIAIGYKDEVPSLSVKEFETGSEPKFSLTLSPSSLNKIKEAIKPYEKYATENKISKDLQFMAKFFKEDLRQKELENESDFILRLWNIAYPCCTNNVVSAPTQ